MDDEVKPHADADDHAPVDQATPAAQVPGSNPRRLFLYESGWRIVHKVGSDREFCYMMAPGEDFYHRLLDGEIYLARDDEKLCLACAERRGLLSLQGRTLDKTARRLAREPKPGEPGPEPPD